MILYFSGTGNSRFMARILADCLNDEAISMNKLIKTRHHQSFYSDKPYVICAPIYAWRYPRIVESFLKKSEFNGNRMIYFTATCASQTGDVEKYLKKICESQNMIFMGFSAIDMPSNYIAMYDMPSKESIEKTLSAAKPQIIKIANRIRHKKEIKDTHLMPFSFIMSSAVNELFYDFFVTADGFHTTAKCTGCGKCTKLCPMNNIQMKDGKPVWSDICTHCMACICGCPQEAVEYRVNTQHKSRYYLK